MMTVPPSVNSSRSVAAQARAPSRLWAASSTTVGSRWATSKRPAPVTAANASVPRRRRAAVEEGLHRGEGDGGVVGLVGAVEGTKTSSTGPGGCAVDKPGHRGRSSTGPVEVSRATRSRRRVSAKMARRSGSASPSTKWCPASRSDLLLGDGLPPAPTPSVWSWPTLVSTATAPSATLVASQRPSMPTSITATSTATSANQGNAAAVRISK